MPDLRNLRIAYLCDILWASQLIPKDIWDKKLYISYIYIFATKLYYKLGTPKI